MDGINDEACNREYHEYMPNKCISEMLNTSRSTCAVIADKNVIGTGFFLEIDLKIGRGKRKYLCSNNHVFTDREIKVEACYDILFDNGEYQGKKMYIELTENRNIVARHKPVDWVLVELFDTEEFSPESNEKINTNKIIYLKPEKSLYNDFEKSLGMTIGINQHPLGCREVSFSTGKIIEIHGFEIIHTVDTDPGSSGSPIINKELRVVGIHKAKADKKNQNKGTIIGALFMSDEEIKKISEKEEKGETGSNLKKFNKIIYPEGNEFDRKSYEGYLKNGVPDGRGKMIWRDGQVYDGEWYNDKKHGKGTQTFPDGGIYEGDWFAGAMHGKGKEIFSDGDIYEGDFALGTPSGIGKFTSKDGDIYEGEFYDGMKQGKGKMNYSNGNTYEGNFFEDEFNGKGKYICIGVGIYEGDFVKGNKHGKGKFYDEEGNLIYDGNWINDEPEEEK